MSAEGDGLAFEGRVFFIVFVACVAQSVERLPCNRKVLGSNPGPAAASRPSCKLVPVATLGKSRRGRKELATLLHNPEAQDTCLSTDMTLRPELDTGLTLTFLSHRRVFLSIYC